MTAIESIEGIGQVYGAKLRDSGIKSVEGLLAACETSKSRKELAESLDVSPKLVLAWANRADLARVKGIGTQYADLLEAAGVDTVPELAQRNPQNLHKAMVAANEEKSLVRKLPTADNVADWVEQAKGLPRALQY